MKNLWVLALLLSLPAFAATPEPVAGRDYTEIRNGRPLDPDKGIVVEEVFNYICPSCNAFQPLFAAWVRKLPSDVKVHYIPATFRPDFVPYARAYYAAQGLGIADKTHEAVYEAIGKTHTLPAEGDKIDEGRIAAFYGKQGVDSQQFLSAMHSFSVEVKMKRADEYMQHAGIASTPSLIVNGRYLVMGSTFQDMLRIAGSLVERERTH